MCIDPALDSESGIMCVRCFIGLCLFVCASLFV